jgi:phage terminase large subunit
MQLQEIVSNVVGKKLEFPDKPNARVFVFQGGSRSGKTYNILLWLILQACKKENNQVFTICRATMPALKGSAMRDFFEILERMGLYDEKRHNRSENTYLLRNNLFEFISIDQPQKIRGRKRKYLFINEANEIDWDSWIQLIMRTTGPVILDYNPSMTDSWIYEQVITREDCQFHKSTYKDNPFLEQSVKDEIERLQTIDDNYWRIYGLGERGQLSGLIFKNWRQIDPSQYPDGKFHGFGQDFGFTNDPSALVECCLSDGGIYLREVFYKTGLTAQDISDHYDKALIKRNFDEIWADAADPRTIHELRQRGWLIRPAHKGQDSIIKGIDVLLQYPIYVTSDSLNLIKELRNYSWIQDHDTGKYINKPIDAFNHAIDSVRMWAITKLNKRIIGMTKRN